MITPGIVPTKAELQEEVDRLRADNDALRNSHAAIYLALGNNEADHTKWPEQISAMREKLERMQLIAADRDYQHEENLRLTREHRCRELRAKFAESQRQLGAALRHNDELQANLAELRRQHAATVADYEYQRSLRAEMREHVVKLLPYAHMLMRGEKPISAYADSLPYIIADAEAATRGPNTAGQTRPERSEGRCL